MLLGDEEEEDFGISTGKFLEKDNHERLGNDCCRNWDFPCLLSTTSAASFKYWSSASCALKEEKHPPPIKMPRCGKRGSSKILHGAFSILTARRP